MTGPAFQVLGMDDAAATLRLVGELDLHGQAYAAEALRSRTASDSDLTLDLSDLGFIDSSGIRVLISAHKELSRHGRKLVLSAPRPTVKRVFDLLGLDRVGIEIRD